MQSEYSSGGQQHSREERGWSAGAFDFGEMKREVAREQACGPVGADRRPSNGSNSRPSEQRRSSSTFRPPSYVDSSSDSEDEDDAVFYASEDLVFSPWSSTRFDSH